MKAVYLGICVLLVLAVVQAKELSVQNEFDVLTLLKNLLSVVSEVAGTAIAAVMTPIL
jgi:hypothetical protein